MPHAKSACESTAGEAPGTRAAGGSRSMRGGAGRRTEARAVGAPVPPPRRAAPARGGELSDPKPTPHSLRHTAVALWIGAGADRYTVSKWAGHTNAAFTEQVYGHLWEQDHSGTRAAIAELPGGASVRRLAKEAEQTA